MVAASTTRIWVRWTVFAGLVVPVLVFGISRADLSSDTMLLGFSFLVYVLVSGLIIARRDGHPTGWLLLITGMTILVVNSFEEAAGLSPFVVAWVASWGWSAVFACFSALTLTFHSGHPPGGRGFWPRLGRIALWTLPFLVAAGAFTRNLSGPEAGGEMVNPYGFLPDWMGYLSLLGVTAILLGGVVSLVVKRRHATGVERAQLSWVVFALVLLITAIVLTFAYVYGSILSGAGDPGDAPWTLAFLVMLLFPISFGIAILRYRLYDIDRIISRTVSYAIVVLVLGLIFAFGVVSIPGLLGLNDSPLLVAASTLVVAALFNPLRHRVQVSVDRRFNRSRYDAARVMDQFAGSLRDEVDHEKIVNGWVRVVDETMQPASTGVWIRG